MAVLENLNLSFVDSKPKARVFIPMYEPLEVTQCEKRRKAIDELQQLLFLLCCLLFRFPFAHYCSFLSLLGRTLSHLHVFPFDLNSLSRFLFGHLDR